MTEPATPIALPADLGIEGCVALHALLAPHADTPTPVTLAANGVSRLHGAGLQVLASFCQTRAAAGHATVLAEPTGDLRAAAARLGLAPLLGLNP